MVKPIVLKIPETPIRPGPRWFAGLLPIRPNRRWT